MSGFELPPLLGSGASARAMPLLGQGVRELTPAVGEGGGSATSAFGGALEDALARVAALQSDEKSKAEGLALGQPVELGDLMMSVGKSEVAFNLMLELRNKLMDAWDKLSRSVV